MSDATIEVADESTEPTTRSQMDKHEGFVNWYNANYGTDLSTVTPAQVIAEFARLRNTYRKSDDYQNKFGPAARDAARAAREEAKELARVQREAEKAAKAEERKAAKDAAEALKAANADAKDGDAEAEVKPKRARKRAATKTVEVDETDAGTEVSEDEAFE